jgi:hypothetical protein
MLRGNPIRDPYDGFFDGAAGSVRTVLIWYFQEGGFSPAHAAVAAPSETQEQIIFATTAHCSHRHHRRVTIHPVFPI